MSNAPSGFVNAHTHIYSGLVPLGMPAPREEPRTFIEILERVWWRLDRALDERALRAAAHLYVAEALLSGTTTLLDHHESPRFIEASLDVIAEVCEELGMRAVLCYGATERNGGRAEARRGLEECHRFIRSNTRPLVRGLVGLHASFTVSDETVREAGELARALGVTVHVHMAEDRADVADARQRGYAGPLERLERLFALLPGSILAHGVHLSPDQVRLANESDCWIVQNPRSNRGNRVGYPIAIRGSSRVALGTDGYPSCMPDEAAALREEGAPHGEEPDAAARRLTGGRELAAEIFGSHLSFPGQAMDADAALFEEGRLRHLSVAGRCVVKDGVLQTGDINAIRAEASEQAQRLWARMEAL
ncbi:MAG: amidohydrolase family protein [Planctomycetota bacterium]